MSYNAPILQDDVGRDTHTQNICLGDVGSHNVIAKAQRQIHLDLHGTEINILLT